MNNLNNEMFEAFERSFGFVPHELLENQYQSSFAREKLRQSFIARGNSEPAAFGSVYLDDEGVLVINIVEGNARLKKEIAEALRGTRYHIKYVTYPWSHLKMLQDLITGCMKQKFKELNGGLVTVYANEMHNKVFVELENPTEEAIVTFKKNIIDSPALTFIKSQGKPVPCTDVLAGDEVKSPHYTYNSPIFDLGTIGFRAHKDSAWGFVAAAHQFDYLYEDAYFGSSKVGYCLDLDNGYNSYSDSAFVLVTHSGYDMRPYIRSAGYFLSCNFHGPSLNELVWKMGITTGNTAGRVTNLGMPIDGPFGGIQYDVLKVKVESGLGFKYGSYEALAGQGDSGGPLYSTYHHVPGHTYIVGITNQIGNDIPQLNIGDPLLGTVGYFSKYYNISQALGCTIY